MGRITEKEIASVLKAAAHVLVTQQEEKADGTMAESLRRIALDVFFAELYDARKSTNGFSYDSVGAFLRSISDQVNSGVVGTDELFAQKVSDYMASHPVKNGSTFTPSLDSEGNLSWSNDGGLSNPDTVNIMGPKPEAGTDYYTSEEKTVFVESVMEAIPYLTALDTVIETDKIVMTQTLSDGTTSVLTALLDENYLPYQATVDGRVIPMTWTLPESNEDEETTEDPEPDTPDEPVEEEWDGVLFDSGVTNEEITGGWDTDGYSLGTNYPNNGSGAVGNTISVATSKAYTSCIVGTEIAVDLTDWNTLTAEVSEATNAFELSSALRVCSTKEAENTAAAVTLVSGTNTIDISALSGSYYIAISVSGSSTTPNMTAAVTKLFASK